MNGSIPRGSAGSFTDGANDGGYSKTNWISDYHITPAEYSKGCTYYTDIVFWLLWSSIAMHSLTAVSFDFR